MNLFSYFQTSAYQEIDELKNARQFDNLFQRYFKLLKILKHIFTLFGALENAGILFSCKV